MGLLPVFDAALGDLGVGLSDLRNSEPDAALGNGGLGRLAACFMEAWRRWPFPRIGYGIRYDHGLFRQIISRRLAAGISRATGSASATPGNSSGRKSSINVHSAAGSTHDRSGRARHAANWRPARNVQAVAYDTPIVGWRGKHVNALRLWSARAARPLQLNVFNSGDYLGAMRRAGARRGDLASSSIRTTRRRPAGNCGCGRNISSSPPRCRISSAAICCRRTVGGPGAKAAMQLNDTHPSLAVAELMRHPGRRAQVRLGRGAGRSPARPSPIPTTRCCPRRWRPGRWNCSNGCCRAIWRSSTGSMHAHLAAGRARAVPATSISAPRCR